MVKTGRRPVSPAAGVLWGALAGVGASLALTALAALLLQKQLIGETAIGPANIAVKVLSAFAASLVCCAAVRHKRVLLGGLAAFVYMFSAFAAFGLILGRFRFTPALLSDLAMAAAAGLLGGAAAGLFSKKG